MLLKIPETKKWPLRKPGMPRHDLVTHLYLMPLHGLQSKPIGKALVYPKTCLYLVLEHSTASKADLLSFQVGGVRSFLPPCPLKLLEELSFRVSPLPLSNMMGECKWTLCSMGAFTQHFSLGHALFNCLFYNSLAGSGY